MTKKSPIPGESVLAVSPTAQKLSLGQALALASQHQAEGRLREAEVLTRKVLDVDPGNEQALQLMGIIAHQAGKTELGIEFIGKAIARNGNVGLFFANRGEMYRGLKRLDEAIADGEKAVALEPLMATAHSNLGIAYYDRKDYDRAKACQQRALELNPKLPQALNNLGSIRRARQQTREAIAYYEQAVAANPRYLEPLSNLGTTLIEDDRAHEALAPLTQALQINPRYAEARCNLGLAYLALKHFDRAFTELQQALQLRPAYPEVHMGMAKIFQEQERFHDAERAARRALELAPEKAEIHSLLGEIYITNGFPEQAEASFNRALALDPASSGALVGFGNLRMEQGRLDEAEARFRQVLETKPDDLSARYYLAQVRKTRPGDENLAALTARVADLDRLPDDKKIILHYALGKCHDDLGDAEHSFPHFLAGARLKRASFDYGPAANDRTFDELMAMFDRSCLDSLRGHGDDSTVPIFVLGMPRSGTTLTEQIIASHPAVHGAGELRDLMEVAHQTAAPGGAPAPFPGNLRDLTGPQLTAWGAQYVERLRRRAPEARHITDKMPVNFMITGLIHLMLPRARIVHVVRNPLDTCLSCFTRLFQHNQHQTYDLAELGRYYVCYARIMDHWRRVLPPGAFHEIRYEELVADQETQSRRLIEYCGLEWDDACLDFHAHRRNVRTASVTQVRQPIYKTSVERWRRYEKFIGPLIDALGDLAPRD